jgi:hypothetical protein
VITLEDLDGLDTISDDELAQLYMGLAGPKPDKAKAPETKKWYPKLSDKQSIIFEDTTTPNLLLVSSRYTGKTYGCGYVAGRHAYDFHGAMVLVVAKTKRQLLAGGLFDTLGGEILPDFQRNLDGFKFVGPRTTVEKDVIFEVTNRWGTKSLIQMMSIGSDSDLKRKVKGITASLLIIDEITLYETPSIFEELSGILGRRTSIPSENQRLIATCNPSSPDHWVADYWSVLDEEKRQPGFKVVQFLPGDNPSPHVADYYERLKRTLAKNPTQYARDIEGKWVAVPEGNSIFGESFLPEFHVRGDKSKGEFLHPRPGLPIVVGWDPGDVNTGVVFLNEVVTPDKILWVAFDEIGYTGKKISLETLTLEALTRMNYWCEETGQSLTFSHVSDKSAFDRFRAATGSYDHAEIQKHSERHLSKFSWLKSPIKMKACPKPEGSVEARSRIIIDLLTREELYISAKCEGLITALAKITSKKDNPFTPDTRSPYKHLIDALSYPIFYSKCGGSVVPQTSGPQPQIIQMGA